MYLNTSFSNIKKTIITERNEFNDIKSFTFWRFSRNSRNIFISMILVQLYSIVDYYILKYIVVCMKLDIL